MFLILITVTDQKTGASLDPNATGFEKQRKHSVRKTPTFKRLSSKVVRNLEKTRESSKAKNCCQRIFLLRRESQVQTGSRQEETDRQIELGDQECIVLQIEC